MRGEIETFNNYLTGNVWGYKINFEDVELDSCLGFYGEWDNKEYSVLTEAKSEIDCYVKNGENKKHIADRIGSIEQNIKYLEAEKEGLKKQLSEMI